MDTSKMIISIEGNIGSGKSTLLEHLREKYTNDTRIAFIKEPIEEWDTIKDINGKTMLSKFYQDQKKYAFPFQMMAYISRLNAMKQTIKENPDAMFFITERSLYTDKHVFALLLYKDDMIEDVNFMIYNKWFECFAQEYPISKMVYVKTDPIKCLERINIRSRDGENCIELDYLTKCHEHHETMIYNKMQSTNTLELDGNCDIFEDEDVIVNWMSQINNIIYTKDKMA